MLTRVFRPIYRCGENPVAFDAAVQHIGRILSGLADAEIHITVTPIHGLGHGPIRRVRWQTHQSRNRLVLETTWHLDEGLMMIDAHAGANPFQRFAAVHTICQQAAEVGLAWAGLWYEGQEDPIGDGLGFWEAAVWEDEEELHPPQGRIILPDGLVAEWVEPSVRIMSRILAFAEDCTIGWESLVVEDLMKETAATYLELRDGRRTAALARVLRRCYLPGMEGYDPRSKTPPVALDIESIEVHPDYQNRGYATELVHIIQAMGRPVYTLDTYRRAEAFWEKRGFRRDVRRSHRLRSNIFAWRPRTGRPTRYVTGPHNSRVVEE